MRFFIFPLLIFLCFAKTSDLLAEPRNEKPFQLATFFCKAEYDDPRKCDYFDEDPKTLRDATVSISGSGTCSGIIVKLMRRGKVCETPLLLTAGHCANPQKLTWPVLHFRNHKTVTLSHEVKKSTLTKLQKQCMRSGDYPQGKNCLLTPQDILNNEDKIDFSGVDQALIPLENVKANLPSVKVDLNSLVSKDDLADCLKGEHKATVASYLTDDHFKLMRKPIPKIEEDYIKADTCNNLSLLPPNNIKPIIGHRCPSLPSMSGSFFGLSCKIQEKTKTALLVYQGGSFEGISEELKAKAREGDSIPPSQYEGKKGFRNTATYIDPSLIDLYVDEYCGFANPPR